MGLARSEDGGSTRPVRFVFVRHAGNVRIGIFSVRNTDGSAVVWSWTETSRSLAQVQIARVDRTGAIDGEQMKLSLEQTVAGEEVKALPGGVVSTDSMMAGTVSTVGARYMDNNLGRLSYFLHGVWLFRDDHVSDSDCLIKVTFSSDRDVVEKLSSQIERSKCLLDAMNQIDLLLSESASLSGVEGSLKTDSSFSASIADPSEQGEITSPLAGRSRLQRRVTFDSCEMPFSSTYQLGQHMRSAHNQKREFSCRHCKRTFTQSGHRNEHERREHLGEGLACELCGKKFGVKSRMERHVRSVHENIRSHECGVCGSKFKQKSHLQKHERSHQFAKDK
ncbi:hypothetical protein NDN08_007206 [Rhodosorus marinus]|uniref:C2H2-type domain-containing protein n=1 Tax=Rhodosorus marinus TaxID=101924 RepID=A0AAV8UFU7_9RHOD|nr:hypothetical protein NDN08_007206 [Rhodosorus marinus]